jgi:hypothetical protein
MIGLDVVEIWREYKAVFGTKHESDRRREWDVNATTYRNRNNGAWIDASQVVGKRRMLLRIGWSKVEQTYAYAYKWLSWNVWNNDPGRRKVHRCHATFVVRLNGGERARIPVTNLCVSSEVPWKTAELGIGDLPTILPESKPSFDQESVHRRIRHTNPGRHSKHVVRKLTMILVHATIEGSNNLTLLHLSSSWRCCTNGQHEHQAHADCDGLNLA